MQIRTSWIVAGLSHCQLLLACAAAPPPAAEPESSGEIVAATPAPTPAPAAAPAASPSTPSPEQQKRADEQRLLAQDFAKLESEQQAELARLTPELRQRARALVDAAYPSPKAALGAIVASPHRKPGNAERDSSRHPQAMLELFGVKQNQTVLEVGPGEGWYTEILAPLLARSGKLYVTETDPNGPPDQRSTLYGRRTHYFLQKLPEAYGKVEPVLIDAKAPKLALDGKLDMVLVFRGLHGMQNNKLLGTWLGELHRALKPNGILGIEQHRAPIGQNPDEASKRGYLPEAFVIEQVEAAGFKLVAKSELNANPKDTKDYAEGVWSLPPTLREGEKNRDKYLAIGESDRMTLKFMKVEAAKTR